MTTEAPRAVYTASGESSASSPQDSQRRGEVDAPSGHGPGDASTTSPSPAADVGCTGCGRLLPASLLTWCQCDRWFCQNCGDWTAVPPVCRWCQR